MFVGRFFKILGRRERTKEEKRMQDAPYFLLCSPMLHMLDPYVRSFLIRSKCRTSAFWRGFHGCVEDLVRCS